MKILKFSSLFFVLFVFAFYQPHISAFDYLKTDLTSALPLENHQKKESQPLLEIDSQSVKIAEEIGGGVYYHEVDAIVPLFPSLVRTEWMNYKNAIAEEIGAIYPAPTQESALWRNTADSIDALVKDAQMAAPYFWEMCLTIAKRTESIANFGIGNQYMIKSKESISRKVQESVVQGESKEEAISKIRDTLRGTIIAETPEQIPLIVQALKEFAYGMGREIVFINIWKENRPSGYVGIHAKMLFPIYDEEGHQTQSNIIIEIQIHLKCIMDGTQMCVKEREHLLYDEMRKKNVDPEIQTAASTLLYLTALKQCPLKHIPKNNHRH